MHKGCSNGKLQNSCAGIMEEKTGEIVVMRSRYTLCIKDAVMANFRIVVLDLWRKRLDLWRKKSDCGDEIEVYLMHKGCSNGKL